MVEPGVAVAPASDLVTTRSGAAVSGVGSVLVLSSGVGSGPLAPSSAITTLLAMSVIPSGRTGSTVTANVTVPVAPAASAPRVSSHVPVVHRHPGAEASASKVVYAGTVSVRTTPVAAWLPVLAYDIV